MLHHEENLGLLSISNSIEIMISYKGRIIYLNIQIFSKEPFPIHCKFKVRCCASSRRKCKFLCIVSNLYYWYRRSSPSL